MEALVALGLMKMSSLTWIPCLILIGIPVGLSLDLIVPVYGGMFIYRSIYKRYRILKNIGDIIDNKKFKTIETKRVSTLYERGFNDVIRRHRE